jgi:hypothetical protein
MRPAILSAVLICLSASLAYGSQEPSQTGQDDKTQRPANQQDNPDATPQEEMKFKLLLMSDGWTESGARCGGSTYETSTHTKLYLTIVHTSSRERAKKEYDDRLKGAVRILNQGKVEDKPATKPASTEDRAVIIALGTTEECRETTVILATAGKVLRIIQSCSSEAAIEFERRAKLAESKNDRLVFR